MTKKSIKNSSLIILFSQHGHSVFQMALFVLFSELNTGVMWYFEPNGIMTPRTIYHGVQHIMTPLCRILDRFFYSDCLLVYWGHGQQWLSLIPHMRYFHTIMPTTIVTVLRHLPKTRVSTVNLLSSLNTSVFTKKDTR